MPKGKKRSDKRIEPQSRRATEKASRGLFLRRPGDKGHRSTRFGRRSTGLGVGSKSLWERSLWLSVRTTIVSRQPALVGARFLPVGARFLPVGAQPVLVGVRFLSVGAQPVLVGARFLPVRVQPVLVGVRFLSVGVQFLLVGVQPTRPKRRNNRRIRQTTSSRSLSAVGHSQTTRFIRRIGAIAGCSPCDVSSDGPRSASF